MTEGGKSMASTGEVAVQALTPFVGPMVADTCIRGTALSVGKTFDSLTSADLPALETRIRRLLQPLVPTATLDRVIDDIRGGV